MSPSIPILPTPSAIGRSAEQFRVDIGHGTEDLGPVASAVGVPLEGAIRMYRKLALIVGGEARHQRVQVVLVGRLVDALNDGRVTLGSARTCASRFSHSRVNILRLLLGGDPPLRVRQIFGMIASYSICVNDGEFYG